MCALQANCVKPTWLCPKQLQSRLPSKRDVSLLFGANKLFVHPGYFGRRLAKLSSPEWTAYYPEKYQYSFQSQPPVAFTRSATVVMVTRSAGSLFKCNFDEYLRFDEKMMAVRNFTPIFTKVCVSSAISHFPFEETSFCRSTKL